MDKIAYIDLFTTYYECSKHNVKYPKGAKCPKCVEEGNNEKHRSRATVFNMAN